MAAGQNEMIGTAGSTATYKNYPNAGYSSEDFHRSCRIDNYLDAHQVRNCELLDMPDLNHASQFVRGKIVSFMNFLIDLGVAGFRVSFCKHLWPNDLKVRKVNLRILPTYNVWFCTCIGNLQLIE